MSECSHEEQSAHDRNHVGETDVKLGSLIVILFEIIGSTQIRFPLLVCVGERTSRQFVFGFVKIDISLEANANNEKSHADRQNQTAHDKQKQRARERTGARHAAPQIMAET